MICTSCGREAGGGLFCRFCGTSLVTSEYSLAGVFSRFVATVIDFAVGWGIIALALAAGGLSGDFGAATGLIGVIGIVAVVGWVYLMARGLTPGKAALGLRVHRTNGGTPGVGVMLVREWVGKMFVSGLFLGLGYVWALFDRDRQAWHDKLAGTVVVKASRQSAASTPDA